jgi:hypothetical protein
MTTTPIERIEFLNAFRTPRRSEFTVTLSEEVEIIIPFNQQGQS